MGSLYLNSNEAIILSTHNVVINTIPAEAILTSQRLILVDSRHTQLRFQDIPFTALETVTIGDTSAMDPVLSLSVVLKDEIRHSLGIVFPQDPKTKRIGERDEWAVKLKEASVNAQQEHGVQPAELAPPWVAGEIPEVGGEQGKSQESLDEKFCNPPLTPRKPRTKPASGNRTLVAAGFVIILIIAGMIGVYFFAPSLAGNFSTATTPVVTPAVTAIVTQVMTTTEQPTVAIPQQPEATPDVTVAETPAQQVLIPQNGVWVQMEYNGNFSASLGASGRMREVTGSGVQVYQIPVKNEIVIATVEKLDNSGNVLTVSFYNDGEFVTSSSTANPHGTVDLHVDLRTPTSVTTPVTVNATPSLATPVG